MNTAACKKDQGFTLIELVIVIVIGSLIFAALVVLAKPYFVEQQRSRTVMAVKTVERAMAEYFATNNSYPCPAPLNSSRGTAEDGTANCTADGTAIIESGGRPDAGGIPRPVLIGAIPYRSLNIPVEATIDAYGNRLTYAVSLHSSSNPPPGISYSDDLGDLNTHTGAIDIVDNSMPPASLLDIPGTAHFFYFSHGSDGKGAFSNDGVALASACVGGLDAENCDNDARFVAALQSYGTAAEYYDDVSLYSLLVDGEGQNFWSRTPGGNPEDIFNTDLGNVGIAENAPVTKLDVNGEVKIGNEDPPAQTTCVAAKEGAMRYNPDIKNMQFCDGANWQSVSSAGVSVLADKIPYDTSFTVPANRCAMIEVRTHFITEVVPQNLGSIQKLELQLVGNGSDIGKPLESIFLKAGSSGHGYQWIENASDYHFITTDLDQNQTFAMDLRFKWRPTSTQTYSAAESVYLATDAQGRQNRVYRTTTNAALMFTVNHAYYSVLCHN